MADEQPISDNEVWERLARARDVLGEAPGSTVTGDTALQAARKALALLAVEFPEPASPKGDEEKSLDDPEICKGDQIDANGGVP
jgi:hypothetical protein